MTLRRMNIESCDVSQVRGGVCSPLPSSSIEIFCDRLGATRAKLAERRASLLVSRPLLSPPLRSRSLPSLYGSSREFCSKDADASTFAADSNALSPAVPARRRHSEPTSVRRVAFHDPLVTDVEYRPYTLAQEKHTLYYSRIDIAAMKARRHIRDREISFADGMVTEVWEPTLERIEAEIEMSSILYYTQDEIQSFLHEFLATLDRDDIPEGDDVNENLSDCAAEKTSFSSNDGTTDDFFDEKRDGIDCGECHSVYENEDENESVGDVSSEEEEEEGKAVAIWPVPLSSAPTASETESPSPSAGNCADLAPPLTSLSYAECCLEATNADAGRHHRAPSPSSIMHAGVLFVEVNGGCGWDDVDCDVSVAKRTEHKTTQMTTKLQ